MWLFAKLCSRCLPICGALDNVNRKNKMNISAEQNCLGCCDQGVSRGKNPCGVCANSMHMIPCAGVFMKGRRI